MAVNQPGAAIDQNRMTSTLRKLAVDITAFMDSADGGEDTFNHLARELFAFQYAHNGALRRLCAQHGLTAPRVSTWREIPATPAAAFKELEWTVVPPEERVALFRSSGTTDPRQSRHFHSRESLAVYEASLLRWFNSRCLAQGEVPPRLLFLTPPPKAAPHSSLVHMFDTLRRAHPGSRGAFFGGIGPADAWGLEFDGLLPALRAGAPVALLGTAFNFVHLLDRLTETGDRLTLPTGSFLMETGGYKGRSRSLPRDELHEALSVALGVPRHQIVCEYGMSELSSQAYDTAAGGTRRFQFPPWTRIQILSPETGVEAAEGEPGLLRVCDLANVASAVVVQTEDLAVRSGDGFELLGRAPTAGPRGCSLMTA